MEAATGILMTISRKMVPMRMKDHAAASFFLPGPLKCPSFPQSRFSGC
jgi:hypothetical protein